MGPGGSPDHTLERADANWARCGPALRAPASGRRRSSRRRRGPPKIRREPACWEPLGRSRRRPTQTSPSDRRASRAPHGPAPASAQASRFTDDPDRTRSSSASPFGAPEGVAPPKIPYDRLQRIPSLTPSSIVRNDRASRQLKPEIQRIRRPCSRDRGHAIAFRGSAFGHGPVRTQRANPHRKRPG